MGGMAEPSPPLSTKAITVPGVEYIVPPPGADDGLSLNSNPRTPKKYGLCKHFPPSRNASGSVIGRLGTPDSRRSSTGSQSTHTLRHQRRRISGGELPPTPPAHSRTPSSSKSINSLDISSLQTPVHSSEDVQTPTSPSTPINQRSPPTPEVTPPRPDAHSNWDSHRPALPHRISSKSTPTDSRPQSFRTALESPEPSEEDADDSIPTLHATPTARTSEVTVRRRKSDETRLTNGAGPGTETDPKLAGQAHDSTPRPAKGAFHSLNGECDARGKVEHEWEDNLARTLTVTKRSHRSPHAHRQQRHEIVDNRYGSPTNATKAVRGSPLQGRILTYENPKPTKGSTAPDLAFTKAPTRSPARSEVKRLSGMSTRSTASTTTVEAILVGTPSACRNRTLRHVKRVDALRDAIWQSPAPSSSESASRSRRVNQPREAARESYASNSTANSISSRKARREIWKSGAIPVVVVPDRHSSTRSSSQDRSVASSHSQRSRRSQSTSSGTLSHVPNTHDLTPYFDRTPRRSRRTSDSDGSSPGDQRTMDFPPTVPRRSSSVSVPTSRHGSRRASINGSQASSLTTDSLQAHNASIITQSNSQTISRDVSSAPGRSSVAYVPAVAINSVPSYSQLEGIQFHRLEGRDRKRWTLDSSLGSPLGSPHLPSTTPFSVLSVETSAEISEAMAVSIDRHQNRSVLMVDHRPSESSVGERKPDRPVVTTSTGKHGSFSSVTEYANHEAPTTPLQTRPPFSLNDVDSPLRNPRAPPEPPILQFIPATPSGLTPSDERPRLLGNFYDEVAGAERIPRGLAIVRRALSKRQTSYGPSPGRERQGLLTRTLSLTKRNHKAKAENPEFGESGRASYEEPPYDESRLHPEWRPSYPIFYDDEGDEIFNVEDAGEGEEPGWPMIDNRRRPPRRTFGQRMKHTFAIMPIRDDYDVYIQNKEPERRTICRDPSGGLRVVKKRGSFSSLRDLKNKKHSRRNVATALEEPKRTPVFPRKFGNLAKLRRRGSEDSVESSYSLRRTWSLTQSVQGLSRRMSERRREKRSAELRRQISAPRDCRDGVEDVIRRDGMRQAYYESPRTEVGRVQGTYL